MRNTNQNSTTTSSHFSHPKRMTTSTWCMYVLLVLLRNIFDKTFRNYNLEKSKKWWWLPANFDLKNMILFSQNRVNRLFCRRNTWNMKLMLGKARHHARWCELLPCFMVLFRLSLRGKPRRDVSPEAWRGSYSRGYGNWCIQKWGFT